MPIVTVLVILVIVGVILGLINKYLPMADSIKAILNAVVVIGVILWLLSVFGVISGFGDIAHLKLK